MDCAWFAKNGVDLHGIGIALAGRSHVERRVRAAMAVEPELGKAFDHASLVAIDAPVAIISFGEPDASMLAQAIPGAGHEPLTGALPSGAFNLCKPNGAAILREGGEDEALCEDGPRPRSEIHAFLAWLAAAFFRDHLWRAR